MNTQETTRTISKIFHHVISTLPDSTNKSASLLSFLPHLLTKPHDPALLIRWLSRSEENEAEFCEIESISSQIFTWVLSYIDTTGQRFTLKHEECLDYVLEVYDKCNKGSLKKSLFTHILLNKKKINLQIKDFESWKTSRKKYYVWQSMIGTHFISQIYACSILKKIYTCSGGNDYKERRKRYIDELYLLVQKKSKKDGLSSSKQKEEKKKEHSQKKSEKKNDRQISESVQLPDNNKLRQMTVKKRKEKRVLAIYSMVKEFYPETDQGELRKISLQIFSHQELFMKTCLQKILTRSKLAHNRIKSNQFGDQFRFFSKQNKNVREFLMPNCTEAKILNIPKQFKIYRHAYDSKLEMFFKIQRNQIEKEEESKNKLKKLLKENCSTNDWKRYEKYFESGFQVEKIGEEGIKQDYFVLTTDRLVVGRAVVQQFLLSNYNWLFAAEKSTYKFNFSQI